MFDWLNTLFLPAENPNVTQSIVVLMLAIGTGVFFGRIKLGKITFGVSAVMFTGLLLGHFGFRMNAEILVFIRDFGLILFVYGIGLQVGPSFFSSFKNEGLKFNILAVSTVLFGGVIAIILFKFTGLTIEDLVGIMSGSVTNTPGLGAAKSTIEEIKNTFPDKVFHDPTIGYAITYPLGVFGIIGTIIFSKFILKIDTEKEMRRYRLSKINSELPLIHQKMRVTNPEVFGKSLNEILKDFGKSIVISRLKHSGNQVVKSPTLDMELCDRDVLMLVGFQKDVDAFIAKTGRASTDLFIESDKEIQKRYIYVTKPSVMHKNLSHSSMSKVGDFTT
jgi:putative transport protein